jgi:ABC-type amino acid transport substrate-binding protein
MISFLISPALAQIFLIALLLAAGMAHIIWLMERNNDIGIRKPYFPGVWDGFWWTLNIVATGEYGDKNTSHTIKRLITICFWLLGVIFIAQFTATVTSSLTVEQLSGSIQGPADLPGKRIAVVRGTTGAQYLAAQSLPTVEVVNITEAYELLEQGQVDAVVYDSPVLLYYATHQGRGRVQVVGPIFNEETYGVALPFGSPYRKRINEALLKFKQDGTYEELYVKWFGEK